MVKFGIVITGWNWEGYVNRALQSVLGQTYKNYSVEIVDDGSTDKSCEEINNWLQKNNPGNFQFTISATNNGTYFARDKAIQYFGSSTVIVLLDGDDALLPNALEECAKQYEQGKLMTYGNWMNQDGIVCPMSIKYSELIHSNRDYRNDTFRCTHLRTFRKQLYDIIPKWDLSQSEVESFPDVEILFSMMEMCGQERIGVIYEPIYIYNETNDLRTLKRFGQDTLGLIEIKSRPKRDLL